MSIVICFICRLFAMDCLAGCNTGEPHFETWRPDISVREPLYPSDILLAQEGTCLSKNLLENTPINTNAPPLSLEDNIPYWLSKT